MKKLFCFFLASTSAFGQVEILPVFTVSSATAEIKAPAITNDDAGFFDTPRAYSSLSRESIDLYNINSIGKLESFDASVQNTGLYGHSATVNIRGDMAELYQNGQRRTDNAAGFSPSFNSVEQIDIVKGAAPIVFGPGFYSGGYLNTQTKRAGSPQESYGFTLGTLSADHSYLDASVFFDTTIKLDDNTSFRASYQGTVNNTFYNDARDDNQDIYLTLHHDLKGATFDLFLEYLWAADPQIEGINRVNQTLISDRLYQSDSGLVPLKPTYNLFSPGDFSNVNAFTVQAIYAQTDFRLSTLAEYVSRRRFNAFQYQEWATQFTLDQRAEWHWDTDTAYTIIGAQARYEYRESYTNYFDGFFSDYDISKPGIRSAISSPNYILGTSGPNGYLFFGPLDGNTDTTLSNLYQIAPFYQQRIKLGAFQVLYGVRLDGYRVFVTDPLTHSVSDNLSTYSFSRMASLIYTRGDWSIYSTYGYFYSVNGTVSGGGIVLAPDYKINKANLRSPNRLYETGWRYDGKIKASLTGFWQYRQQTDLYSYNPNNIQVRGFEGNVGGGFGHIGLSLSATYNEGNFVNSLPFEYAPTASAPGDYRIPGLSRVYGNSMISYLGRHWIISLIGRYQSEQSGNILDTYYIPSQYTLDSAFQYKWKHADFTMNLGNLTNRFNWVHNNDEYGDNAVIHHEPLRNISITIRIYQ